MLYFFCVFFSAIAMVVRFITRRFIGEYDPNLEQVYTHATAVDGETVLFEILDAAGPLNVNIVFPHKVLMPFALILFAHKR